MTLDVELHPEKLDEIFLDGEVRVRTGFSAEYAAPVNYGSDPHWPPLTPMVRWTDRMGWENYGLDTSMEEGAMWDYVDERRAANEPLPAAYYMAQHIAENGTEPMLYASDAFIEAQQGADAFVESMDYDSDVPLETIAEDFANWSLELAIDNLNERVSAATTGKLQQSASPARAVEK